MINPMHKEICSLRGLSGSALKMTGTIAMVIDHFCVIVLGAVTELIWFPMTVNGKMQTEEFNQILSSIRPALGDLAFPLFCLLLSEGYHYTHNRKKYISRMLFFAIISEVPFDIAFFSELSVRAKTYPFYWKYQNVFFTYVLSLICLYGLDKIKKHCVEHNCKIKLLQIMLSVGCVSAAAFLAELLRCDYGAMGVLLVVAFYLFRDRRVYQAAAFLIVYIVTTGNQPNIFVAGAALVILLYNGKEGKKLNKYFFYLFYPAHITVLYLGTLALRVLI